MSPGIVVRRVDILARMAMLNSKIDRFATATSAATYDCHHGNVITTPDKIIVRTTFPPSFDDP
jgi:hypothetical protein